MISAPFGGHPRTVWGMAFSPDGSRLRTAGDDGTVRLWATDDGGLLDSVHAELAPGPVFGFDAPPWPVERVLGDLSRVTAATTGPVLAVGLVDGRVHRHAEGVLRHVASHAGAVTAVAADERVVVSAGTDLVVRVWNERADAVTSRLDVDSPVRSIALTPSGCVLVDAEGRLWLWALSHDRSEQVGRFGPVLRVASSATGWLACAYESGHIVLSNEAGETAVLSGHGGVLTMSVHDGVLLTAGGDHTVRSWHPTTGEPLAVRTGPSGAVRAVSGGFACDEHGVRWELDTGRALRPSRGPVGAAVFAPDGTLVTGGLDGRLSIGEDLVVSAHDSWVRAVDAGPDLVVSGSDDCRLVAFTWTGRKAMGHELPSAVHAVAVAPDGRVLAGCEDGSVRLFDEHGELSEYTGHTAPVHAVLRLPGGRVAAGAEDGSIRVWEPSAPDDPAVLEGHVDVVRALVLTPDGRLASGGDDGTIRLWDLATGSQVAGTGFTAPPPVRPRAGIVNDEPSADDLLGFGADVDALAALIADRATEPPLSIALLGPWGAGKSSFLHQVEARVRTLSSQSRGNPHDSVYTASVRQIRFNAWQYSDDHLWVGLIEHLFTGLDVDAEPPPDAAELRERSRVLGEELERVSGGAADGLRVPALLRLLWRERTVFRGKWGAAAAVLLAAAAGAGAWALWGGPVVTAVAAVVAFAAPVVRALVSGYQEFRAFPGTLREKVKARKEVIDARLAADPVARMRDLVARVREGKFAAHRGVLGAAAEDLRVLSDGIRADLAGWRRGGAVGPPPLERVVLYIDDLDRCPPTRVLDVLAAVHLLLALPVFVVVVAVDPAWLRRALVDEPGYPVDYLDKIFQIAFALRPMGAAADGLVDALLPDSGGAITRQSLPAPVAAPLAVSPSWRAAQPSAARPRRAAPREPGLRPARLSTREAEREFVKRVRPLLPTPRAVKRLVNAYRLIRAGIPAEHTDRFVRPDGTGPYRAVLVLLAIAFAEPPSARERLGRISAAAPDARLTDVVALPPAAAGLGDLAPMADYQRWVGTVARFGFDTTDLVDSDHPDLSA